MVVFTVVCPELLADFAASVLQGACKEAKREAFQRIKALALYQVARGRKTMKINGRLAVDFTNWLILG